MIKKEGHILIIDDDNDVLKAAQLLIKQHVNLVRVESEPMSIPDLLKENQYDVILLDMNFTGDVSSGEEGFFWMEKILKIDPEAVVILITAFADVETAVKAIKAGATDFVQKPWQNEKLLATVNAGLKLRKSRIALATSRSREKQLSADIDSKFSEFIGESNAVKDMFSTIHKVAKTDANILILGENGTGKELIARELHRQSSRSDKVFLAVDLGAIADTLFESELFGHVKGAFTDAKTDRPGRFETASGGTLFLDEIGNLRPEGQAKLLTALEKRTIMRVGSNKPIPIDIRLICATNKPIHDLIDDGRFREDLLYRINTVEIRIPPLRDRPEDIPLLLDHFINIYRKKYDRNFGTIDKSTILRLQRYRWPGNVRELRHSIERAVIMCDSDQLKPEDFLLANYPGEKYDLKINTLSLENAETEIIRKALRMHEGNISRAAKALGLTRTSLYRRMQKYDI